MCKKHIVIAALVALTGVGYARGEASRAFLTTENKFPEKGQPELSYLLNTSELEESTYRTHSALLRYGLIENLTARIQAPYVTFDSDVAEDTDGVGDLVLGFDLLAYEDIFRYPYVIPHLDISFPTGDEDEGLGTGDTDVSFGVSVGTVVYEVLHYVLDVSYITSVESNAANDEDGVVAALSIIWDISKRFSVMAEGAYEDISGVEDNPFLLGGGMSYKWTDSLDTSIYFGGWEEADTLGLDQELMFKASYTF